MASGAKSVTRTNTVVNNNTGVTTSTSKTVSGGKTTITTTKTIGSKKTTTPAKKTSSTPAKAAGCPVATGTRWIIGPNMDGWTMCGPVAVANALLAATGIEATNADVEQLYRAAGGLGDSGALMGDILAAAARTGLAGERLAKCVPTRWQYSPTPTPINADLAFLAVSGFADMHAAAIINDGREAVMWGAAIPLTALNATVIDAWSLTWHGQEGN